jgi:hypothetical protein
MLIVNIVNFGETAPTAKVRLSWRGGALTAIVNADGHFLEGGAKDHRSAAMRRDGAFMTVGGNQEKFPSPEKAGAEGDYPVDNLKNRELGLGVGLAALFQQPSVNAEGMAINQRFALGLAECRFKVVKIDTSQGLFDVELSRLAVQTEPVPIEDAVSGIAVLLDLKEDVAGANCVKAPARNKNISVRSSRNPMQKLQNLTAREGRFEIDFAHPILETDVDPSAFIRGDKIPELGLRLGKNIDCSCPAGMNLEREGLGRVQDLYKNRKTLGIVPFAKNFLPVVSPDFVQGSSSKFRLTNDALCIFAIDQFPRFPNRIPAREDPVKTGLQFAAAPNSFHV